MQNAFFSDIEWKGCGLQPYVVQYKVDYYPLDAFCVRFSTNKELRMKEPIIQVNNVTFTYEEAAEPALQNVSMDVRKGEFLAVLGHNGSGKSTLAKLLNALYVPTEGKVTVCGMDTADEDRLWDIRQQAGMIFQNPDNQIVATVVQEDVAFGLENLGIPHDEMVRRIDEALAAVRMTEHAASAPHMLSGGQKQRVAIAGILAMQPSVIIADEATAMLDPSGRQEVLKTIKRLNRDKGITVVWITHFMEEAAQADRIVVMNKGSVALSGTPREVFQEVETLRGMHLDVPHMTDLAQDLNRDGMPIRRDVLTVEEMADEVCRLLPAGMKASASLPHEESSAAPVPALEARGLTHTYSAGSALQSTAIRDVSLTIGEGEFVCIVGHTGSGKSTLVQHLNGLLKPTSGAILVEGEDLHGEKVDKRRVRQKVGLVFQYPEYQLFEETIAKDIAFGPKNQGLDAQEIDRRVRSAMAHVHLDYDKYAERSPFELSGGQMRRVAIAGVIAMEPKVLILDEPAAGLDPKGRDRILGMIQDLHKEGVTVVMVSHSMDDCARLATRMIVMSKGSVVASDTPRRLFSDAQMMADVGLGVPQAAKLCALLRQRGYDLPQDIYTQEEMHACLLGMWKEVHQA